MLLDNQPNFKNESTDLFAKKEEPSINTDILPASSITYPAMNDLFGEVISEKVDLASPLFYGDNDDILAQGAGMFNGSKFPGEKGLCIIGGHNRPMFGRIYDLVIGDQFTINTHYGSFIYEVIENTIISAEDNQFLLDRMNQREEPQALLYTCFPLEAIGWAPERVIVVGRQISVPIIDETK
ncbi:class D sortase [Enterococcus sp. BWM-S5]|uniref:Class D sortase n=1 Tax=Enterococcus larvae TaxID=2794352 RepID=A0ABS4CI74_9ENTE|nr:class D sortase [Enterococcus larvae]MBP1046159.1 class D sortase [Enterococcus larvae]